MISIIIASVDNEMFRSLERNIQTTIGVPYEVIVYKNIKGKSIAEVYNQEAKKAKFNILCFAHEDIIFKTNNWGERLIHHFKSIENVGLVGAVGSTYKSLSPSGWYADSAPIQTNYGYFIQSYKHTNKPAFYYNIQKENSNYAEVVTVDGFWMCTTKEIFNENKFDQILFNRFHCYDIDFSLTVGRKYKVVVAFNILIEHLSEGVYDKEWIDETLKLHQKWKPNLPIYLNHVFKKHIILIEKRNFRYFIAQMFKNNFNIRQLKKVLLGTGLHNLSILLFIKMYLNIFTNPYKNKI